MNREGAGKEQGIKQGLSREITPGSCKLLILCFIKRRRARAYTNEAQVAQANRPCDVFNGLFR
jgi:hypothetical protein